MKFWKILLGAALGTAAAFYSYQNNDSFKETVDQTSEKWKKWIGKPLKEAKGLEADTDHDGTIDTVAIDSNGDGHIDTIFKDVDQDGLINRVVVDEDHDGSLDKIID